MTLKQLGDRMQFFPLQLLVLLLHLGKAVEHKYGKQSHNYQFLLQRNRRDLLSDNPEEVEEKPDLFVAMPHLIGAGSSRERQKKREKMLSRLGRFWKKPERELNSPPDLASDHIPPRTKTLTQSLHGMQIEKSPLREEAKKFWHHFMFRMSQVSQGIVLPIKSHEVHQETCRTVPFSQVFAFSLGDMKGRNWVLRKIVYG